MNKRKIQAVINRIKGDIVKYNKEIDYINKNYLDIYPFESEMEAISEYHGRLDEMKNIIDKLEMLKESIDNNSPKTINTEIKIYKKDLPYFNSLVNGGSYLVEQGHTRNSFTWCADSSTNNIDVYVKFINADKINKEK